MTDSDKKLSSEEKKDQKDQQRDPALQSYGGDFPNKAADPDENIILEKQDQLRDEKRK